MMKIRFASSNKKKTKKKNKKIKLSKDTIYNQ